MARKFEALIDPAVMDRMASQEPDGPDDTDDLVSRFVDRLLEDEQRVVQSLYWASGDMKALAVEMGLSYSTVRLLKYQALACLKGMLIGWEMRGEEDGDDA